MNTPHQDQPPLGDRIPANARLLSRLGEAAKGVEVEPHFYLVASAAPLARVYAYGELPAAQAKRDELGEAYGAYGPFVPQRRFAPSPRPTRVRIEFEGDEAPVELEVGGSSGVDALFFSASALDKFVYPYYANFVEPAELKDFQDAMEQSRFWLHDPTSTVEQR